MRILVAMRSALQGKGIAHVLHDVAPDGQVLLCDKRNLLGLANPADGRLSAAVIAHPWISIATLTPRPTASTAACR